MFKRRSKSKVKKMADTASERVSTNVAVPVGGALGATMLGAALIRRRRRQRTT